MKRMNFAALLMFFLIQAAAGNNVNVALLEAARKGETKVIQGLIADGADVDYQDEEGLTALIWVFKKATEIASANFENNMVITSPVDIPMDTIQALIAAGADVNLKDKGGGTVLIYAAAFGYAEAVRTLTAAGADVDHQSYNGLSALILAAGLGHTGAVKALIAAGADVNLPNLESQTALMLAAGLGHAEIVQLLITAGADVNVQEVNGITALMLAVQNGHTEIVRMLEEAGAG